MTENEALTLKIGDVFIYPDGYVNGQMKHVKHNYKCTVLAVIVDDDARQGFTIKRYLKTRKRLTYEFFDIFKVIHCCDIAT